MPFPLLPIAIAALASGAYVAKSKREKAAISPQAMAERAVVYETALNHCKDPDKLRQMAMAFRQQGHIAEADMLVKRALLREAPPEVQATRKEAFKKGMASTDSGGIRSLADAFDSQGATGAAAELRAHARALESTSLSPQDSAIQAIEPVEAVH